MPERIRDIRAGPPAERTAAGVKKATTGATIRKTTRRKERLGLLLQRQYPPISSSSFAIFGLVTDPCPDWEAPSPFGAENAVLRAGHHCS
jgi:hypothetical protein